MRSPTDADERARSFFESGNGTCPVLLCLGDSVALRAPTLMTLLLLHLYVHVRELSPEHARHRAPVRPRVVAFPGVELRAALVEVGDDGLALVLLVVVGQ